jgi:hypothetical protein
MEGTAVQFVVWVETMISGQSVAVQRAAVVKRQCLANVPTELGLTLQEGRVILISRDNHSARAAGSVGRKAPNFSAKWICIAPDSKTRMRVCPLRSIRAGILEFGFTPTKSEPN